MAILVNLKKSCFHYLGYDYETSRGVRLVGTREEKRALVRMRIEGNNEINHIFVNFKYQSHSIFTLYITKLIYIKHINP